MSIIESLDQYREDKNLCLHLEAITFYRNILENNEVFRAAVVVGSFAKGTPDRLSDIDLITFVEDENTKKAFEILTDTDPFAVVHSFSGTHESKFSFKKSIFENYVSAEVHVAAKSTPFRLKRPFITLFDHDNFLASIFEDGAPPKHEEFPALGLGEPGLAWELHDLIKWWTRGQKELVKNHIKKIAKKLDESPDEPS